MMADEVVEMTSNFIFLGVNDHSGRISSPTNSVPISSSEFYSSIQHTSKSSTPPADATVTGATKLCDDCGRLLNLRKFQKRGKKQKTRSTCTSCRNIRNKYFITGKLYNEIWENHKICAFCKINQSTDLDHCHKQETSLINKKDLMKYTLRGFLCKFCNTRIFSKEVIKIIESDTEIVRYRNYLTNRIFSPIRMHPKYANFTAIYPNAGDAKIEAMIKACDELNK